MAHRFCARCRLQQLDPNCGLQITQLHPVSTTGLGENIPGGKDISLCRANARTCLPCAPGAQDLGLVLLCPDTPQTACWDLGALAAHLDTFHHNSRKTGLTHL